MSVNYYRRFDYLLLFYSLSDADVGAKMKNICLSKSLLNKSLPQLRVAYSVPLTIIVRSLKITAVIAKVILWMVVDKKMILLFEKDLYNSATNVMKLLI